MKPLTLYELIAQLVKAQQQNDRDTAARIRKELGAPLKLIDPTKLPGTRLPSTNRK